MSENTRHPCLHRWALVVALSTCISAVTPRTAKAHETDQYTLPPGREFADLSDSLTRYLYNAVAKGVERQNSRIKEAVERKAKPDEIKNLQSPDEIASSVNKQFPVALFFINDLDEMSQKADVKAKYPGRLVGYKNPLLRKYVDLPLNPFNAWECATIKAYGTFLGTDKFGHFSDMGMHYFRAYREQIRAGKGDEAGMKAALKLGTQDPVYSERGLLGLSTAGAYSNADLVANFMGMCFYRNLTEQVMLKGQPRPPMLVLDGNYWKLADHVRPDSDFFSWFISEHLNEALNPSWYRDDMRPRIKKAIIEYRKQVLPRYTDANGNCWSQAHFAEKQKELETYWGFDYGHEGTPGKTLLTIADTCFAPPPDLNSPNARNGDGLTSMHWAAQQGDVGLLQKLVNMGGEVNARVQSDVGAPAIGNDTPLHVAARDGKLEAVQYLLSRGADPNAKNDRGDRPLHMALIYPQVAEVLIHAGADIDAPDAVGRTPLHWAARDRRATSAVRLLLDSGAKPQPMDRDGETPLHDAARAAHAQAVVALVRGGCDADARDRFGVTPLHLAAAVAGPAVTDVLVQAGAAADVKDDFGFTPLHVAASLGQSSVVELLLARGANPNLPDVYGKTATAVAAAAKSDEIVDLLKDRAAEGGDAQTATATVPPQGSTAPPPSHQQGSRAVNASALPQVRGN